MIESIDDFKRAYLVQLQEKQVAETLLEQKSLELHEKNHSLSTAISQLKQQQHQLVSHEKLASIGQLAAGLAHEINNPNAFIRSNLKTLREYGESLLGIIDDIGIMINASQLPRSEGDLSDKIQEIQKTHHFKHIQEDLLCLIDESEEGSRRIQSIISELEYFSNSDTKLKTTFDMQRCIESSITLLSSEFNEQYTITTQLAETPLIRGNRALIGQAISNVIRNAIQASVRGGTIEISSEHDDTEIIVSISDQGSGIAAEKQLKIFDPFYTTKHDAKGLGLSITQAIMKQHGGYILISSQPGRHTKVCLHYPKDHDID